MSQIPTEEDRPYWCESSTVDSSLYRVGGLVIPFWDAWDWYERVRGRPLTTERDIRFFGAVMGGLSRHLDRVVEDWPKERYVAFTAYGGNLSQGPENCLLATQAIGMPESCRNLKEEEIPQFEAGEKEDHFRQYLAEQGIPNAKDLQFKTILKSMEWKYRHTSFNYWRRLVLGNAQTSTK